MLDFLDWRHRLRAFHCLGQNSMQKVNTLTSVARFILSHSIIGVILADCLRSTERRVIENEVLRIVGSNMHPCCDQSRYVHCYRSDVLRYRPVPSFIRNTAVQLVTPSWGVVRPPHYCQRLHPHKLCIFCSCFTNDNSIATGQLLFQHK